MVLCRVHGLSLWKESIGEAKVYSDASSFDDAGKKLLTVSDEAFGLFLVENYMEKWVKEGSCIGKA